MNDPTNQQTDQRRNSRDLREYLMAVVIMAITKFVLRWSITVDYTASMLWQLWYIYLCCAYAG